MPPPSPIISRFTGNPIQITDGKDISLSGQNLDRPNVVLPGQVYASPKAVSAYLNPAAFQCAGSNSACTVFSGQFGNLGRNSLYGPGQRNFVIAHGNVKISLARSIEGVAPEMAELAAKNRAGRVGTGALEGGRVQILQDGLWGTVHLVRQDHIGAVQVLAAQGNVLAAGDLDGVAGEHADDRRNLPVFGDKPGAVARYVSETLKWCTWRRRRRVVLGYRLCPGTWRQDADHCAVGNRQSHPFPGKRQGTPPKYF